MQSGPVRRAAAEAWQVTWAGRHRMPAAVLLLGAMLTAACKHDPGPMASVSPAAAPTLAFESIDGPPMGVFQKLVQNLAEEADARQVAVVSREGTAQYRLRGYMAAHLEPRKTTIAWVWDVYDSAQNRALRISGEEAVPGRRSIRDGWSAADDRVLRRIAQASLTGLAPLLRHGAPVTAAVAAASAATRPDDPLDTLGASATTVALAPR